MRVDIIVPNFDDSSDNVILSAWYKKIGDRISKNEIIADAETAQIACGITSSYDCILTKILVKEGEEISQGTKIAIIETDLDADISDVVQNIEAQEIKVESAALTDEIEKDAEEYENEKKAEADIERQKEHKDHSSSSKENYRLSVPLDDTKQTTEDNTYIFNVVEAEKAVEKAENESELLEEAIEDASEHTGEKVANILKKAEAHAKEEAKKIKDQILEDAKKQAVLQGEEIKKRIIKEYEEKALKDASEMHQKIVQGSLTEAENTKSKLLNEAKEKAEKEAAELKDNILKSAENEAKGKALDIEDDVIKKAKEEAESRAKEIIEETIKEAKSEAKEIKKDIIHSATKHAVKESENTIKESNIKAKKESQIRAETIIENALISASQEAQFLKNDILKSANAEIKEIVNTILISSAKEIVTEIKDSMRHMLKNMTSETNHEIKNISNAMLQDMASKADNEVKDSVYFAMKDIAFKIHNEIKDKLKTTLNDLSLNVNNEVTKNMEHFFKSTETAMKKEIKCSLKNASDGFITENIHNDKIPLEETIKNSASQDEIVKMLIENPCNNETTGTHAEGWNKPKFFASPNDENVPIDFLKQRINEKLKSSMESSIISTVSNEVDMSAILSLEKTFGKEFSKKFNTRLGFTPFFILASISALKHHKVFNAHIHENTIIYKNNFDISIITCGNDGVIAPVIRNADLLSISEIERMMINLSKRAVDGTLSVEEVSGGTFTVVNAGIYGSLMGTDLLTLPQVATLSVHRMHNRPIATDNGVEVKPMLYISLSYDHRIADTKQASEFLANIKIYVENPGWTILGL